MRKTPYTKADYISSRTVREYMQAEIADHVDPLTGEVNATTLAEDACEHFDGYEGGDSKPEVPEKFFDLAALVGERHEVKTGVTPPRPFRALAGLINSLESDWF